MDTFKVMLLLFYLASLDNKPRPFLDIEITKISPNISSKTIDNFLTKWQADAIYQKMLLFKYLNDSNIIHFLL